MIDVCVCVCVYEHTRTNEEEDEDGDGHHERSVSIERNGSDEPRLEELIPPEVKHMTTHEIKTNKQTQYTHRVSRAVAPPSVQTESTHTQYNSK